MPASEPLLSGWKLNRSCTKATIFANKSMREYVNHAQVNGFIHNKMGITYPKTGKYKDFPFTNELTQIKKYSSCYSVANSCYKTKYSLPKHGWGRICPDKWLSVSIFHRPTRHTLCSDKYVDLDMVNAQPHVVNEICKLNGIINANWQRYCDDPKKFRHAVANHYGCSYDAAKRLFLTLSFGGSYATWLHDENISPEAPLLTEVTTLEEEIQEVIDLVYEYNREISDDVLKTNPGKWNSLKDRKRGVMGMWCQTIERILQECVVSALVENGFDIEDIVPCQDGIMILKEHYNDGICSLLSNAIMQNHGLVVNWIHKPFDQMLENGIPLYEEANIVSESLSSTIICETEDEASNYLFERMKGYFKSYKKRLFLKIHNIWLSDTNAIEDALLCKIMNINICRKEDKSFSKNYNDAIKIRNALIAKIRINNEDSNLYNKFHYTTRGKLCFEDGVLDITTKTFRLWSEIDSDEIYTTVIIPRKFAHYWNKPNTKVIDEIKQKLFEPLYGDKTDEALHFLSRAMCGFVCDKRWGTYLGNRNCGKGVEYTLFTSAFGPYVSTFELGNILYTRKTACFDNMTSKELYWLLDLEFVRLAVSQEVPDINSGLIGSGKMIKKLCGGDDTIVARRNYDRFDTHFIIDSTFYIKGNFSFQCDSADCYETCCQYSSVTQFKTRTEIDAIKADETRSKTELKRYRLSDPDIKSYCVSEEWANACVMLMVNNYRSYAVPIHYEDNDEIEANEIIDGINEKYEITLNPNDVILVDDIKVRLPSLDKKKVALELQSMNVHRVRCNRIGIYRNKWVYSGIKIRSIQNTENESNINNTKNVSEVEEM